MLLDGVRNFVEKSEAWVHIFCPFFLFNSSNSTTSEGNTQSGQILTPVR